MRALGILLFIFVSLMANAADLVVFHGVDLQSTFWEAMNGREAGVLAAPGSAAIFKNVYLLTEHAHRSDKIKSILTKDSHTQLEVDIPKQFNSEFDPNGPTKFPRHAMMGETGKEGDEILPEIAAIYAKKLIVPHHVERNTNGLRRLELKPFMPQTAQILDPSVQIVINKNGEGSYDFAVNPYTRLVLAPLHPKRVYIYGVATDFCVFAASMTYRKLNYETYLVTDAIAGIYPELTQEKLKLMREAGVQMVTTAQVLSENPISCGAQLQ